MQCVTPFQDMVTSSVFYKLQQHSIAHEDRPGSAKKKTNLQKGLLKRISTKKKTLTYWFVINAAEHS